MPTFLYDFPNSVLGAIVSGLSVVVALAGYAAFRRFVRTEFTADDRGLAMAVLAGVAPVHSLLLAFYAVSDLEGCGACETAVFTGGDA